MVEPHRAVQHPIFLSLLLEAHQLLVDSQLPSLTDGLSPVTSGLIHALHNQAELSINCNKQAVPEGFCLLVAKNTNDF